MANLVLRTEFLEKLLDRGEYGVVKEEIKDLRMQVRTGLEEVRQIIFNLRPMALDDLGFQHCGNMSTILKKRRI